MALTTVLAQRATATACTVTMTAEVHPNLRPNYPLWRFMDLAKFVVLLETGNLHFTRPDRFDDPFEGTWPKADIAALGDREGFLTISKKYRTFQAFNCWHANTHESAAMWGLYLKSDEGVAVRTTAERLARSFVGPEHVLIVPVRYIDYETERISVPDQPVTFDEVLIHKRASFRHEQEVRAWLRGFPPFGPDDSVSFNSPTVPEGGLDVAVDLPTLIECVYVAPEAPRWFGSVVQALVRRYGIADVPVHTSRLSERPVY